MGYHQQDEEVTSCIQCESLPGRENAACIAGTVNGTPCGRNAGNGCFVQELVYTSDDSSTPVVTAWHRGCCPAYGLCIALPQLRQFGATGQTRANHKWCTTNDCNLWTRRRTTRSARPMQASWIGFSCELMVSLPVLICHQSKLRQNHRQKIFTPPPLITI